MAERGGRRPGAGRKPKSETHAGAISRAEKKIADHLPQLIENMLTLAKGVIVQEVDEEDGIVNVYSKPPDRQANEYLINRIMGKPTERQELTGADGGPIRVDNMSELTDDELLNIASRGSSRNS